MAGDKGLEQLAAFLAVEVDDFDAVFAEPVEAAGKGAALPHDQSADAELAHQATAIPAGSQRGYHDQVAIAALSAGAAEGVRLAVDAWIALLHAAIVTAADQLAGAAKKGSSDWDAAFIETKAGFFKRHGQHAFVQPRIRQCILCSKE